MPELLDFEAVRQKLIALPIETYQPGDTVLADGSTTGKVLVLKEGAVEVVKDGVQLGKVTEPGAVFGELSALLGEPHAADVRALESTTFHVGEAASGLSMTEESLGIGVLWHRGASGPVNCFTGEPDYGTARSASARLSRPANRTPAIAIRCRAIGACLSK